MLKYTNEEVESALSVIDSTIVNCEKFQFKFEEGTSQHSLLRNRIKALYISKALIIDKNISDIYTKEDVVEALKPIISIISKCEKANKKFQVGTVNYIKFKKIIDAMYIAKSSIIHEISVR